MLKFNEDFITNYAEDSDKGYIFEVDVEYPKHLHDLLSDLPFFPERMKINKYNKLVYNLHHKSNYVVHTRTLKQALNHGLILKKVHKVIQFNQETWLKEYIDMNTALRSLKQALNHGLILKKVHKVIQFNQEAWLKEYIDMNTALRKQAKNDFEKDFFKLMNNSVFGKTMENVRKHRDIKLVTTDKRRNQLVSEPNYHTIKCFSEKLLAIELKKIKVKMNKPVYLGLSILETSKRLMYEFWCDYIKTKYENNGKLCYMDTERFIIYIKTEDVYEDITDDVEKRFDI